MINRYLMEPVNILLRSVKQLEEESLNTYQIYGDITDHFGLKRLLLALEADVASHIKTVTEILLNPSIASLFSSEKAAVLPASFPEVEYAFDANMAYQDFLQMILRREQAVAERYEALESAASDNDTRFIFKRMAEDCQKHVWLAKDRYDLEALI
ncbi:MAG: hypothetical protein ACOCW6_04595 [Spirochaetota bacterium]